MATPYDVCVIGAGPGGFSAATRAAARQARVALVEAKALGGVCLNSGCIPSRAIGTTATVASLVRRSDRFGVKTAGTAEIVWPDAIARKDRIVRRLQDGLAQLATQRHIDVFQGRAVLQGPGRVAISSGGSATTVLETRTIIVATGSRPKAWNVAPFDGRRILSSDDLLRATELPKRLAIIGGGVIGCEFASYLAQLGVEVTVYEMAPQLLSGNDAELAQALANSLTRAGARVITGALVKTVTAREHDVLIQAGEGQETTADQVLVTIGRQPNTAGLGLEQAGVTLTPSGCVNTDKYLRAAAQTIFAVGDVLGRLQTAYTASEEGAVAAENALGAMQTVDESVIPDCIFTIPEIATVGLTEAQARKAGLSVAVSRVPWTACGRAMTLDESDGFMKLVYDTASQKILGAQIIGPRATDLIGEATVAVKRGLTLSDLAATLHAHPTLSEMFWEAAAQPLGRALYVR